MTRLITLLLAFSLGPLAEAAIVVNFEEVTLFTGNNPAGGGRFYNGNDGSGTTNQNGWISGGVFFGNSYNGDFLPAFDFWSGWAYSDVTNNASPGFLNQYAAFPGGGSNGVGGVDFGGTYAIASGSGAYFNLPENSLLRQVDLANTTYAALSMTNGDAFAKPFGGVSGNDPDLFSVTLRGYDGLNGSGTSIGAVTVHLADFTFEDNSLDFILSDWQTVDLTSIATARSVRLEFFSTDTGAFGINTPLYLALDNLTYENLSLAAVPEPSGFALMAIGAVGAGWWCRLRRKASSPPCR